MYFISGILTALVIESDYQARIKKLCAIEDKIGRSSKRISDIF